MYHFKAITAYNQLSLHMFLSTWSRGKPWQRWPVVGATAGGARSANRRQVPAGDSWWDCDDVQPERSSAAGEGEFHLTGMVSVNTAWFHHPFDWAMGCCWCGGSQNAALTTPQIKNTINRNVLLILNVFTALLCRQAAVYTAAHRQRLWLHYWACPEIQMKPPVKCMRSASAVGSEQQM